MIQMTLHVALNGGSHHSPLSTKRAKEKTERRPHKKIREFHRFILS